MSRFIIIGVLALGVILAGIACGDEGSSGKEGEVAATWIQAQVEDDIISISADDVNNNKIVHFYVPAESDETAFMAYDLDGNIHVRANVCPPCQSIGFSLDDDILVCDTCSTTFKANTGEGISGACVNYPKASVSYEINGGYLVMQEDDLVAAYQTSSLPDS